MPTSFDLNHFFTFSDSSNKDEFLPQPLKTLALFLHILLFNKIIPPFPPAVMICEPKKLVVDISEYLPVGTPLKVAPNVSQESSIR